MNFLPDTNIWVALVNDRHEFHKKALNWFDQLQETELALFCRMTQNSFMRLITSANIFAEDAVTNREAIKIYRQFQTDPRVGWVDEAPDHETLWFEVAAIRSASPKRWMDAYLCALARSRGLRLVTFDRGFQQYDGLLLTLL